MQLETLAPPAQTKPYSAHFRCFRGCAGAYSIYDVIYTCPHCGGLLEVHHDVDALAVRSADEWRRLLDSRAGTSRWPEPLASGRSDAPCRPTYCNGWCWSPT